MVIRKKRQKGVELTADIAAYIRWLWANTSLNQAQIAAVLGALNQGRVSEVLNNKRFAGVAPKPWLGEIRFG